MAETSSINDTRPLDWEELHQTTRQSSIGGGNWPVIASDTSRFPVPGGWLYRHREHGDQIAVSITFVPDPSV